MPSCFFCNRTKDYVQLHIKSVVVYSVHSPGERLGAGSHLGEVPEQQRQVVHVPESIGDLAHCRLVLLQLLQLLHPLLDQLALRLQHPLLTHTHTHTSYY